MINYVTNYSKMNHVQKRFDVPIELLLQCQILTLLYRCT